MAWISFWQCGGGFQPRDAPRLKAQSLFRSLPWPNKWPEGRVGVGKGTARGVKECHMTKKKVQGY